MPRSWKLLVVPAIALAGAGFAAFRWAARPEAEAPRAASPEGPAARPAGPAVPAAPKAAPPPELEQPIFKRWRRGILFKNPEQVLACDRAFLEEPARYRADLARLAEHDPEERVRSFSTRVLGKMAFRDDSDLFARLLEKDPSAYVRENAAWGLGQLGLKEARAALGKAGGDAAENVRAAAQAALKRCE